jgi:integrase
VTKRRKTAFFNTARSRHANISPWIRDPKAKIAHFKQANDVGRAFFNKFLGVLGPRERLIFRMAVFDGMRPGEILAIRIGNISGESVLIDQRAYKGNIDTPKGRKGKRTSRTVGLSPGTIAELNVWRMLLLKQGPESYLFPTERETPLRRDNVWYRDLLPKLKPVGLEWATFQVLRRTNASLSRRAMIDDKVAADQRGHGLGVSLEVYSISGVQQKIDAAKRLESEVIQ